MSVNLQLQIPLSQKTFYGIGGPANEYYEIDHPNELSLIWQETIQNKIPHIILGKGSNIVFSDKGFKGRIFNPKFKNITKINSGIFSVEAGCNFQDFIEQTNESGYEDLCNLSGIPGNMGGFVRGNAGAYGTETADNIISIKYLDENGMPQKISKNNAEFQYRGSIFKTNKNYFILEATFKLNKKSEPQKALQKSKAILQERWAKYPPGRSGGCVFKNPENNFAGKLLDELDAKGDQIGNIKIADQHANFFVNLGNGTQQDIIQLIQKWQKKVQDKHNIHLEPEIFICDEFGEKLEFKTQPPELY